MIQLCKLIKIVRDNFHLLNLVFLLQTGGRCNFWMHLRTGKKTVNIFKNNYARTE